ncbi:MAG: LysR family transcriptional regulator [Alphaproteobacteria bacterium]|nr:LysR family transcriptional regulator [Alphaproteobacteria bacterium]
MRHNLSYYCLRLKQLLYLGEAVRFGSISKAADANDIKQPNFSTQLTDFEKSIKQKLLTRSSLGVVPTDICHDYYVLACELKNILDKAEKLPDANSKTSGVMKLWTTDGLASIYLAACFEKFCDTYPNINFEINFSVDMPKLDEFDMAVLFQKPKSKSLTIAAEHKLAFSLFASKEYVQKYGTPKNAAALCKNHKICSHGMHTLKWHKWNALMKKAGHLITVTNSTFMVLDLVKSSVGIGLLPVSVARLEGGLIEIENIMPRLMTEFYVVVKREAVSNSKIKALVALINDETAKL